MDRVLTSADFQIRLIELIDGRHAFPSHLKKKESKYLDVRLPFFSPFVVENGERMMMRCIRFDDGSCSDTEQMLNVDAHVL